MIKTKSDLRNALLIEKKYYLGKNGKYIPFEIREKDILYKHTLLLRKAEYYTNTNNKIFSALYKIRLQKLQNKYGLHIPLNTCDVGLNIAHVGNIVINDKVRIGKRARIHVGVNIGASCGNENVPIIGDDVYIGPGVKIFGKIVLADGIKIGANAVVNKSCDVKDAVLVGVPAKVVEKHNKSLEES